MVFMFKMNKMNMNIYIVSLAQEYQNKYLCIVVAILCAPFVTAILCVSVGRFFFSSKPITKISETFKVSPKGM